MTSADLTAYFLKGMAQGCGFIAGMVLTFSALSVALALLTPAVARWLLRVL